MIFELKHLRQSKSNSPSLTQEQGFMFSHLVRGTRAVWRLPGGKRALLEVLEGNHSACIVNVLLQGWSEEYVGLRMEGAA